MDTVGADGSATLRPVVDDPLCGMPVQVLDLVTCELSPVAEVGEAIGDGDNLLYAAAGRSGAFGTQLWRINVLTGVVSAIGDPEVPLTGLSFAPEGTLYGVQAAGCSPALVYTINLATGVATEVHEGLSSCWSGFTWTPGSRELYAWSQWSQTLYNIDLSDGSEEWVYASAYGAGSCLTSDADDQLYRMTGACEIFAIDPETATESFLGIPEGCPLGYRGYGCTFLEGTLYVAPSELGAIRELVAIDIDTMTATPTGIMLDAGVDALASRTP